MTNGLSEKDADDVIKTLLSQIRKGIDESKIGSAAMRVSDIANRFIAVRKAGSTPDTYCKTAGVTLKHGIATDLRTDREGNMILSFRYARPDERPPSPEICSARWEMIQSGRFEEIEIDSLSQKEAEEILKELRKERKEEFIEATRIDFVALTNKEIHFLQRTNMEMTSVTIVSGIDTLSIYATKSTPLESSIHILDIITDTTIRILSESIIFIVKGSTFKLFIPIGK